jgi:tetratricopeptide (TPR) repeat protein
LIREGVTGAAGHVAEPYLQSTVRPDILFSSYLAGFNLIESFYLAIPHLGWRTVVIGDPLCAPFAPALARQPIEETLDPETALPADFARRRVAQAVADLRDMPARAVVLTVRAENLLASNDHAGARVALEESTALAPRFVDTQFQLAQLYEHEAKYEQAIDRYRRVLALRPDHAVALNNIAYALAVRQNEPREALPFARQAAIYGPNHPSVLDTYGWIQHLLGDNEAAARILAQAVRRSPKDATIRLHAAVVYAARGERQAAESELQEALRINPAIDSSGETKSLHARVRELLNAK